VLVKYSFVTRSGKYLLLHRSDGRYTLVRAPLFRNSAEGAEGELPSACEREEGAEGYLSRARRGKGPKAIYFAPPKGPKAARFQPKSVAA